MLPAIKRRRFADPLIAGLMDDVVALREFLSSIPLLAGAEVDIGPVAAAGTFQVAHGLKAIPRGYIVLELRRAAGATGGCVIYRRTGDVFDATTMDLYASAAFEALKLWVF